MNLRIKSTTGITLNGNLLSGNTFPVKDWVKTYLGGKWNADQKAWTVDVNKVNALLEKHANIYLDDSQPEVKTSPRNNNWYVNTRGGRELAEDF